MGEDLFLVDVRQCGHRLHPDDPPFSTTRSARKAFSNTIPSNSKEIGFWLPLEGDRFLAPDMESLPDEISLEYRLVD